MMKRPTYETCDDLSEEDRLSKLLERKFNCTFLKMPRSYEIDFICLRDDKPMALIEVKRRSHQRNHYPTFFISLRKVIALRSHSRELSVPAFIVVQFSDVVAMVRADKPELVKPGGRTDRGDPLDVEPMVHFPTNIMTVIHETKH